jgi:hypothetical protein
MIRRQFVRRTRGLRILRCRRRRVHGCLRIGHFGYVWRRVTVRSVARSAVGFLAHSSLRCRGFLL